MFLVDAVMWEKPNHLFWHYIVYFTLLIHCLSLGHTVAKQIFYTYKKKDFSKWSPALQLFETALKLCKISATEEHEVEAEILFQKGKMYLGSELG